MINKVKGLVMGKKGRFVAFGILAKILVTGAFFLLATQPKEDLRIKREAVPLAESKQYMQFNDFVNGKFRAKSFYPNWVSGNEYVSKLADNSFVIKKIEDATESEILSSNVWDSVANPYSYSLSSDQLVMAIFHDQTDGYAHYVRTFSITFFNVTTGNKINIPSFPSSEVQKFQWSPTNHGFSYVTGFDVYVALDELTTPQRLTTTGDEQLTFNGVTDWLHLGEITDNDALLWWSPDGEFLAYATLNESGVRTFEFSIFGDTKYPTMTQMPYPKVGTNIPFTYVTIVNVTSLEQTRLEPHPHVGMMWGEFYLNSGLWRGNNIFTQTWKSRMQNESLSENCIAPNFTCTHVHSMMTTSATGWIGHYRVPYLFPSSNDEEYFTVMSNNGFIHLVRVNVTGNELDWRTNGSFEVTDTGYGYDSVHHYDSTWDFVYYTSTEMESSPETGLPRIRHLWKVKARGNDLTRTCISCSLNVQYPDRCNWVTPTFSPDGSFLVVNCGGTGNGVPLSTVHKLNTAGNYEFVRVAENNTELQQTLQAYYYRERVYGTITLPGVNGDWYYSLHKPPNFDETKKYPMLVQVYSGPGFQEAADYWRTDWASSYVASSNLDVIVMSFDGRGTGFRGDEIMHMIYRKLGQYEPLDQIEAARQLAAKFDYIDSSRIAIWGRSYGGYATSRTIGEDVNQVFKCGFAVAPVIDWTFYQTLYTEKYMGLPVGDNEDGYTTSTTVQKLENYGKHYFVLVHGTADENVHIQNSAKLSKALIEQDVDFGNYFAADEWHGFNHLPNGYAHHYKLLLHHLDMCFNVL